MSDRDSIRRQFEEAGLRLQLATVNRNEDIFGMSVTGDVHHEIFLMQTGDETNEVKVLDTDKEMKQVLLMVKEEAREFFVPVYDRETRKTVQERRVTDPSKRKFLVGMDERSYFMAPVSEDCINIRDAKQKLRNPGLKRDTKTIRQGEWFFQPVSQEEMERIEASIKDHTGIVYRKQAIGRLMGSPGGKPHVADEMLRIRVERAPERVTRWKNGRIMSRRWATSLDSDRFYVRGRVRHADHKTVKFSQWMRVMPNMEKRSAGTTETVVNFID